MKKIKRVISVILALCIIVGVVTSPDGMWEVKAEITQDGRFEYRFLSDRTIELEKYAGASVGDFGIETDKVTVVEVPEQINGVKVTSIGFGVFLNKRDIVEVQIPASVNNLGGSSKIICGNCPKLTAIHVADENTYFSSQNGVLFNKQKTELIKYPEGMKGIYTVPSSVTSIGPNAMESISGLTGITIPDSVTSIGYGAFAFCDNLTEITIPSKLSKIDGAVFSHCTGLKNITIPSGISRIGYLSFHECSNLTSVTIPSSVSEIADAAFYECNNLKNVYYEGTEEQWDKIRIGTAGVTGIDDNVNTNAPLLNATIHFSDGSTRNGSEQDYEYQTLSSDTIEITGYTGTDDILTIPSVIDGKTVVSIGGYAFNGRAGITEITIPDTVTTIKPYAFYRGSAQKISLPSSVTNIGQYAFQGCEALTAIDVDEANAFYSSDDGVLYNKNKTTLISCPAGKKGTYAIASGVKDIDDYAFFGCSGLTEITIPSGVTNIQEAAFDGCSGLTNISIPSSVTTIGSSAFAACSSLTDVVIPSSVTSLGISAFRDCTGLKTATIPFSVNRIEQGVFYNCASLENITIPSSVTEIGQEAFSNCKGLRSITLPTSIASVQESAFAGCTGLSDVYYSGSEDQWNKINISAAGNGNRPLQEATIHFNNGTTINGPEKDADYKIGTISAYDQAARTVRFAGQIYAAADSLDFSGLGQFVSSREQMIASFRNGKITKVERVKDALQFSISIAENSKPPITLQSNGYLEDCQDILVRLEVKSSYPDSAFQGAEDLGLQVSQMTISTGTEGFCISRTRTDRDETTASLEESINQKLLFGKKAEYEYVIYAKKGFTFTEEELPYVINVKAETEKEAVHESETMYAHFEYTQLEENLTSAKEKLDALKSGDPFGLEKDLQNYLTAEQIDVIESYLFTWLAEINYAHKYQGSSGVKKLLMHKTGLDSAADFTSGSEKAITHVTVDTKYGQKTIEFTLDIGKPDSQGNLYPAYGKMNYEILEKNMIPEELPTEGQIGKSSYTDMGAFIEGVAEVNENSLHSTYQWEKLQDEITAGVLIDTTIVGIIGEEKGSFSDATYKVYAKPIVTFSKKVQIACPVDVYIYNMDGRQAGSIVNNEPNGSDPNVQMSVNGDTKTVYLTGNDYYLNLRGTDTGTMKYEVEELANEEVQRKVQFYELQLKKDMQYEGYVFRPLNIDSDLYALRTVGDSGEVFHADADDLQSLFKRIQGLSLSQQNTSLTKNKTVQLSASLFPLDASNPNLQWTTDNESIAKVDSSGLVTATGAGRATVTVSTKDGSFLKQFCVIDVANETVSAGGSSSGGSYGWSGGGTVPSVEQEKTPVVVNLHYIVQFDANGGTNLSRKTMTLLADDNPGIMPKVKRKDYTFEGWYTQQDGGTQVTGDKPLNEATTLYAQWTKTAAPAKSASVTLKSNKKGQIQVSYQKVSSAKGYQIDYSTSKNFTSVKTKEAGASVKTKTISGLNAGKKYYVRVRAYDLDSMGNRIYGAYSAVKSVKVKS